MSGKSGDRSIHWDDDGLREEHAGRPDTSSTYLGGDRVDVGSNGEDEENSVPPPGYKWYLFEKAYPDSEDEEQENRDGELGKMRCKMLPRDLGYLIWICVIVCPSVLRVHGPWSTFFRKTCNWYFPRHSLRLMYDVANAM